MDAANKSKAGAATTAGAGTSHPLNYGRGSCVDRWKFASYDANCVLGKSLAKTCTTMRKSLANKFLRPRPSNKPRSFRVLFGPNNRWAQETCPCQGSRTQSPGLGRETVAHPVGVNQRWGPMLSASSSMVSLPTAGLSSLIAGPALRASSQRSQPVEEAWTFLGLVEAFQVGLAFGESTLARELI